jgi:hypothetical protein
MTEWIIASTLGFLSGFAACWFGKDAIQKAVIGANALSAKLHAKADVIKAGL